MSREDDLVITAARLARSAPQGWEQFLGALREYSALATQNCIQSPLEELPRNQGRAQATAHLHMVFAECLSRADKIEGKRK